MSKKVSIEITPSDKYQLDSLIKFISRAGAKLEGAEIIVVADAMRWAAKLQKDIEKKQNEPDELPMKITPVEINPEPKKKSKG